MDKDNELKVGAYKAHIERAVAEAVVRHDVFKKVMAAAGILISAWGTALAKSIQSGILLWLPIVGIVLSGYLICYDGINYDRERAHIKAALILEPSIPPYSVAGIMHEHLKLVSAIQASAVGLLFVFIISALVTARHLNFFSFN